MAATIGSKKGVLVGSKDGCRFAKGEGPKSLSKDSFVFVLFCFFFF